MGCVGERSDVTQVHLDISSFSLLIPDLLNW